MNNLPEWIHYTSFFPGWGEGCGWGFFELPCIPNVQNLLVIVLYSPTIHETKMLDDLYVKLQDKITDSHAFIVDMKSSLDILTTKIQFAIIFHDFSGVLNIQ